MQVVNFITFVVQFLFMEVPTQQMSLGKKIQIYNAFTKFRLASLVVLSALSGYLFAGGNNGLHIFYLLLAHIIFSSILYFHFLFIIFLDF